MNSPYVYIPVDRRWAMSRGEELPEFANGAVLSADISGFTPITESFVQQLGPRRGADEMTNLLNSVYDALIADVHRFRGSVIGFRGDAISCWFDGDNGVRATTCALSMQQSMQQFAAFPSPTGEMMSLAMKSGIAVGPVRRLLVGNPDIQCIDVLAGNTLERMDIAENNAAKGEVVLDRGVLNAAQDCIVVGEHRCDESTGYEFVVATHVTCNVDTEPWPQDILRPDSIPTSLHGLREEQVRPWLLLPICERLTDKQGEFLAEIRPAVPLFLRFSGIDYDHDPDACKKFDTYVRWVQAVLTRYEGFLIQLTVGDKGSYLYAVFGAPIAHDDDPMRALEAALALRSPPPTFDYIRHVQIGISCGQMRTGAYGSSTRRTYGVLGDEVNLAARLMAQAQPGQILVSSRVVHYAASRYQFQSIGTVAVKGKKEPIAVSLVLGKKRSRCQPSFHFFHTPLLGRANELAFMHEVLAQALSGAGQVLRIEGEPGIGKSHLTATFWEQAAQQGILAFTGTCQSISQSVAYTPWSQIFQAFFALPEASNEEEDVDTFMQSQISQLEAIVLQINRDWVVRLPLLGDLLDLPIADNATTTAFEPRLRQEALLAFGIDLIEHQARFSPLLLMIEDAHWMDEPSRALTLALSRVLNTVPVLLVLVHRLPVGTHTYYEEAHDQSTSMHSRASLISELSALPYHHHLKLDDLSPEAVEELVSQKLQGSPSPLALSLIHAKAEGNPFFVEALVDNLRDTGKLYKQHDDTWTLSDAIVNTLRTNNCLTRDAHGQWLLKPAAPLSSVDLGIPASVHGMVLSRMDRLPESQKLTLKVASVIGHSFILNVLSQAHPSQTDLDRLLDEFKNMEANDFAFLEVPPSQTMYMFKYHVAQEIAYGTLLESQRRELHRAVAETMERLYPDAAEQLAYHYGRSGNREKFLFYIERSAHKAQREYANETALNYYHQGLAQEERWEWRSEQVQVLHILGRRDEEFTNLKILQASSQASVSRVAYLWGQYHEAVSDYPQAIEATQRALMACQCADTTFSIQQVKCLNQLGMIARRQGDYAQARLWYLQALDLLQAEEETSCIISQVLAQTLDGLGTIYRLQGDYEEARVCYERSLWLSQRSSNLKSEADALNNLGNIADAQHHVAESLSYYRKALERRQSIGDRAGEGTSLANMAMVLQNKGDYGQSREYFLAALSIQQAIGNRWEQINILNGLGVLQQELGDFESAHDYLQLGLSLAQAIGDKSGQSYLLANLGMVVCYEGNLDEAEQVLTDGLNLAREQVDPYMVSYFLSYLSTVHGLQGQYEAAIAEASDALRIRREHALHVIITMNLAMLATFYMELGEHDTALDYARQALGILDECDGEGMEMPQQDYFLCYRVLERAGQTDAARKALESAYRLVMVRAEKISDAVLRQSFLDQVQMNREVVQAWNG